MTNKHQQFFGHLIRTADSLEKALMPEKTEGRRRRGQQRMRWLRGWHHWLGDWTTSISRQEVAVGYSLSIQSPSFFLTVLDFYWNPQVLGMLTSSPALRRSCDLTTPISASQSPVTVIGLEGARDPNRMTLRAFNGHGDWEVTSFLLDFSGVLEALRDP